MIQSRLQHVISTLEQKQTYLKSVPLNKDVVCTATFLKKGKEIAFYEAVMTNPETNEIYVKASQTALLTPIVQNKEKKQAKM